MDPFIVETYFHILEKSINDLKLSDKPHQLFNIDETSFNLDPSKTKVVGLRNAPSSRVTSGPGRESTTLCLGGNAAGEKLPPLIVFKGKNIWDTWMAPQQLSYPNTSYAVSENGWMESDIFFNYFKKTFLKSCGEERPILLIYDGHLTHIDERTIRCAIENKITIKLPPHSSHILQPMDLAVFKSLKSAWDVKVTQQQRSSQGKKISKRDFSCLVSEVWKETSPNLLVSGFRKAGIYPFSREVINMTQYDPQAYDRYLKSKEVRPEQIEDAQGETSTLTDQISQGNSSLRMDNSRTDTPNEQMENTSYEKLLLQTVKQNSPIPKKKRKKIAGGAEIITSDEYMKKVEKEKAKEEEIKRKEQKKKTKSNVSKQSKNQKVALDVHDDVQPGPSGIKKTKKK